MIHTKKTRMDELDEKIFLVIKFWLMSVFQGVALIVIVFFLGAVDALHLLLIGIVLFIASLVITKRFDKKISALALWITKKLNHYPKIRKIIIKSI